MFDTWNSLGKKILHVFCSACKRFLFFSYYLTQPPKSNILPASYASFLMWKLIWLVCESLHFSLSFTKPPGFMCHGCHVLWSICSHSSHSLRCAIPASQEQLHQFSECFSQLQPKNEGILPLPSPCLGHWAVTWILLIWLMTARKDWLICGEGEGEVIGGVDGLILLIRMMNSAVTGKLLFLKAAQT